MLLLGALLGWAVLASSTNLDAQAMRTGTVVPVLAVAIVAALHFEIWTAGLTAAAG